jgi:putative transposase
VLGARLVHSAVRRREGRGKIERLFRTVRDEFLVELATTLVADLAESNRLFTAWVETVYHRRVHSETGQAPIERFDTTGLKMATAGQLREAFLWSETRTVTKVATVSLHSNYYQVDVALVGREVDLVFDPLDLTDIEVRLDGRWIGTTVPHRIGRHSHPAANRGRGTVQFIPIMPAGARSINGILVRQAWASYAGQLCRDYGT